MQPPLEPDARSSRKLSAVAIAIAVVGLAASIASLIDWLGATPAFCAESGCAEVRASAWSHPLGVPLPVLGIAFFAAAIVLGFVDAPRLRRTLALLGGAAGIGLIAVQAFSIGAWCKLCLVADPAAIAYAIAVFAGATALRFSAGRALALAPGLAAAIAGLALWTHTPTPAAPSPTSNLPGFVQAAQVAGTATVVEVVDFECPFCRQLQQRLETAMSRAKGPVRVVRKMMPLAGHPHAMPAALAYCCADAQGKGEAMAAALFAAPPDALTPEGCEELAVAVGCDRDRYRRDMPAAQTRVAAEMAEARGASVHSLPTLFIGDERIVGASKTADELTAMLDHATR